MRFYKSVENTHKEGSMWLNFKNSKSIGLEYNLRFDPFNLNLRLDGREGQYIFSFWFIYVFYISFNFFRWYPSEYNSYSGTMIDSAIRVYGITQYGWRLELYFHHDGEISICRKDNRLFYKSLDMEQTLKGNYRYKTISEFSEEHTILLSEGKHSINVVIIAEEKEYKRFYMRNVLSGYYIMTSDVEIFKKEMTQEEFLSVREGKIGLESFENSLNLRKVYDKKMCLSMALMEYTKLIYKLRKSDDWVPYAHRLRISRNTRIDSLLN